ncbi:MAG: protein kinase, partial [Planctomycetota bacterium]
EYRLVGKLGQGGMGDVYIAKQDSLDRLLAVKVIKPLKGRRRAQLIRDGKLEQIEEERQKQFLSEAIVTSDLDHPNIVPIHDVALTSRGDLFYSMKRVVGTPWSDAIRKNTRDENLEILLKACDAVAFAHTRGVIHRDIKPENIMLGKFGVVMVMDWGLALPTSDYEKQDSIYLSSGLGGTPAFMAPELATGPLKAIGPAADVYLLGATLYMIITGKAPHQAKNVMDCLRAVKSNTIRPVPQEQQGELLDIALKAMETDPKDRYPDVPSFQQAIRDYRSHAESISLAMRASEDLEAGTRDRSYADLSRAAFRFEEAIRSWPGNRRATEGLELTRTTHAQLALEGGDFDLGLSLLNEENAEHEQLIRQLRNSIQERDSRQSRLQAMRRVAVAMLAFILIGGAVALALINNARSVAENALGRESLARQAEEKERVKAENAAAAEKAAKVQAVAAKEAETAAKNDAIAAKEDETKAKLEAIAAKAAETDAKQAAERDRDKAKAAEEQEKIAKLAAEKSRDEAQESRDKARIAQAVAERERERARYEQYVSMIGLAKARLDRNEADGARDILNRLRTLKAFKQQINRWEWRWLWQQANQSQSTESISDSAVDLATSPNGEFALVVLADGGLQRLTLSREFELSRPTVFADGALAEDKATCVAIDVSGQTIAVGTRSGDVLILDAAGSLQRKAAMHTSRVNDAQFTSDGLLVTGSSDRTLRVWDPQSADAQSAIDGETSQAAYHLSAVRQIAAAGTREELRVVAAVSENTNGRIAVWDVTFKPTETTGDSVGKIEWERSGTMTSHRAPVTAVAITADGQSIASGDLGGHVFVWNPSKADSIDYKQQILDAIDLVNTEAEERPEAIEPADMIRLVDGSLDQNADDRTSRIVAAHRDAIRSVRFSPDGRSIVTASDDYTIKLWDSKPAQLVQTLKGHGGWVVSADFLPAAETTILSASNDASVRTWVSGTYVGAAVVNQFSDEQDRQTQAHADEIVSAVFSADGQKVVTASQDHTARIMRVDPKNFTFKQSVRLENELLDEGSAFVAMSLGLDQSSERLFIGSADATIRVWDLMQGTQLSEIRGTGLNTSFAVSQDGRFLLTGSSDPKAKALLWKIDADTNAPPILLHQLGAEQHDEAVTAFAISPESKQLFTADRTGRAYLWDRETGNVIDPPINAVLGFRVDAAAFSPNGKELLIASDNKQVTIVDIAGEKDDTSLPHDGIVTQLMFVGEYLLTISEGEEGDERFSEASFWDLKNRRRVTLDRVANPLVRDDQDSARGQVVSSVWFDQESDRVVVSRASNDGSASSVKLFEVDPLRRRLDQNDLDGATRSTRSFALPSVLGSAQAVMLMSEDRLITMNRNGGFQWSLKSQRLLKSYRPHATLTESAFSPDGKYVVTVSRSLKIWDADTGKALAKLESSRPIETVQFAPMPISEQDYVLATGDVDGNVALWKWDPVQKQVKLIRELVDSTASTSATRVRSVRFSPTAEQLFVVGESGRCQIWSTTTDDPPKTLLAPDVDFLCGAISADGFVFAAGAEDKEVRVWRLDEETLQPPVTLDGHADAVNGVVILGSLEDGIRVVTASSDDTVRVWDPRLDVVTESSESPRGREIVSLRQHAGNVTSVDATRDGSLLMTAGRDGKVILWPAKPPPENLFAPE